MAQRTIAAVATPAGEGAIGVIRISGENAFAVADSVFSAVSGEKLSSLSGYRAAYGEIIEDGTVLDDAVALVFRQPHSYTGEDTVELSIHGGSLMLKNVLRLIYKNGAFPAEAGEFTKRAFLNGKLDLTKAESIMGLISARSDTQLRLSREAHNGRIGRMTDKIISDLLSADAAISVYSDYPDEDIEELSPENFSKMLSSAKADLDAMLSTYDAGKLLRDGIETAIVGKPNVGKSTLMNMLSGSERSIVTEIAGTTRDIVEETVLIGEIILKLCDTAGIHKTDDMVESIGVERAREKTRSAQLILAVFDCTAPLDSDDLSLLDSLDSRNTIIIINKTDLENRIDSERFARFKTVEVSAKNGGGYDALCRAIAEISGTASLTPEAAVLISERQRSCAARAYDSVKEALSALESGCTIDAVGVCLDDAIAALLELTGKRVTTEVTDEIFRKFCVGK